jgi:ABC-type transport system involved in cytochrome c biogenesis permease subunit
MSISNSTTLNNITKLEQAHKNHPLISNMISFLLLFIWFYLSFHYLDTNKNTKNINYKKLFIKFIVYNIPFIMIAILSKLLVTKQINIYQYCISLTFIAFILMFSWFYLSFYYIDSDENIKQISLLKMFRKYLIYSAPWYLMLIYYIYNNKYTQNLNKLLSKS